MSTTRTRNLCIGLAALTMLAGLELAARYLGGLDPGVYLVIVPALALVTVGVWLGGRTASA